MDWLDLLAVQGTLKSLLQYHSSKASIPCRSAFFTVQLSHPYMTTGKNIALTRQTFVGKAMSLLFNMLSRLFITFLPRSKLRAYYWTKDNLLTAKEHALSNEGFPNDVSTIICYLGVGSLWSILLWGFDFFLEIYRERTISPRKKSGISVWKWLLNVEELMH